MEEVDEKSDVDELTALEGKVSGGGKCAESE